MFIIGFIVCLIIAILIYFIIIQPKLNNIIQLNNETIIKEQELKQTIQEEEEKVSSLKSTKKQLILENTEAQSRLQSTRAKEETLLQSIETLKAQADRSSEEALQKNLQLMSESMNSSALEMREKFLRAQEECEEEYIATLEECVEWFNVAFTEKKAELSSLDEQLTDMRLKTAAAVDAARREQEMKDKILFYSLAIGKEDKEEIEKLKSVIPYLRDAEPLAKVIWKTYYERPYNELMGRIIGVAAVKGIYKITNKTNQMVYIGQSVNIASRLKDHIKAGLGINSSNNKLYTAMKEFGVEEFTYEVLDKGDIDLNEREKFWIDYYQSNSYGYNSTRGGS